MPNPDEIRCDASRHLLSRPPGTLSSTRCGGEGWGEEAIFGEATDSLWDLVSHHAPPSHRETSLVLIRDTARADGTVATPLENAAIPGTAAWFQKTADGSILTIAMLHKTATGLISITQQWGHPPG